MAQTREGAMKAAAKRMGIDFNEYAARIEANEKWCSVGKHWQPRKNFWIDNSRGDGLSTKCIDCSTVNDPYASLRGRESAFKGKKHTKEAKEKMSKARKGKPSPKKGITRTKAEREAIRKAVLETQMYGKDHPNYVHGNGQRNLNARRVPRYRIWREAVFERDSHTCQKCGDSKGGNLRAHHIKPFADHPVLRFDVSNGITLCHTCHELTHFKPDSIRNQRKLKRGQRLWK